MSHCIRLNEWIDPLERYIEGGAERAIVHECSIESIRDIFLYCSIMLHELDYLSAKSNPLRGAFVELSQ